MVSCNGSVDSTDDWVIDLGANSNCTGNFSLLIDPQPITGSAEGYFGHGSITHVGKCRFVFQNIEPGKPPLQLLVLVYYVPHAPKNLLSPQTLLQVGCHLHLNHTTHCDYNIAYGFNLYRLCTAISETHPGRLLYLYRPQDRISGDQSPPIVHNNALLESVMMSANVALIRDPQYSLGVHALLGHHGFERWKDLINTLFPGQSISKFQNKDCEACKVCKTTRKPYPEATLSTVTRRCKRLRIVLSGRIPDAPGSNLYVSLEGYTCFLLVKDEYSHFLWFIPIRTKTAKNVKEALVDLITLLNNKFPGETVTHIVSDCGTEFVNSQLDSYAREHGILFETVPPGESQSNGLIEREMRTIKESGDAALTHAGLHKGFWPHAYAHATYLHNFMARYRRHSYHPPAPPHAHGSSTSDSYLYPYLALYHVSTPEDREWHTAILRRHFASISNLGQSGIFKPPTGACGIASSVSTRAEPAIYMGAASNHFSSYLHIFLPNRGLFYKAPTSSFIPSHSRPFDYARLYIQT